MKIQTSGKNWASGILVFFSPSITMGPIILPRSSDILYSGIIATSAYFGTTFLNIGAIQADRAVDPVKRMQTPSPNTAAPAVCPVLVGILIFTDGVGSFALASPEWLNTVMVLFGAGEPVRYIFSPV